MTACEIPLISQVPTIILNLSQMKSFTENLLWGCEKIFCLILSLKMTPVTTFPTMSQASSHAIGIKYEEDMASPSENECSG
jgi:hypothetical protein